MLDEYLGGVFSFDAIFSAKSTAWSYFLPFTFALVCLLGNKPRGLSCIAGSPGCRAAAHAGTGDANGDGGIGNDGHLALAQPSSSDAQDSSSVVKCREYCHSLSPVSSM